jgi:P3 major capsid protein
MAAQQQSVSPAQANAYASMLVRQRAKRMVQRTYQQTITVTSGTGNTINIPLRPVGLLTGLKIAVSGTIAQSASETLTRTALGAANVLSNISLVDLSSNTRVNAPGWYLHALATVRRNAPFGAAYTSDDTAGYGSNFAVNTMPSSVTTSQNWRHVYDVPVAVGPDDLRGAIYAAVTSATLNLQITVNPNFVVASGGNGTQAVYTSSTAALGTIGSFQVTVYQEYFDMLPTDPNSGLVILPPLDLAKAYMINYSVYTGLAANAQFPISFANWREFQSAFFIYDNNGTLNVGTDITEILLQSANLTNIIQVDPYLCQLYTRERINVDMPKGTYYLDFRRQPLITQEFGNMQLTITPSAVTGGAQLLVGWEAIADQNTVMLSGAFRQN